MALINMGRFPSSRREIVLMYNEQERCLTEKNLELVEMKNKLQEKEKRIKELEDKFGITQKKEWSIRKLKWWFLWLEKNDTDYVIGGSIYVKTEHFDQFLEELRQMNN